MLNLYNSKNKLHDLLGNSKKNLMKKGKKC